MNKMRIGGLAAGMFVVGLLTGMAGTAVARDETQAVDCAAVMSEHMAGQETADMMSMMGGSMMGGGANGRPGPWIGPDMMGSTAWGMPGDQHEVHHRQASPGTAR